MNSKVVKKPRPSRVCQACKKRKVKCDRVRPVCRRCKDNNTQCVYLVDPSPPVSPRPAAENDTTPEIPLALNRPEMPLPETVASPSILKPISLPQSRKNSNITDLSNSTYWSSSQTPPNAAERQNATPSNPITWNPAVGVPKQPTGYKSSGYKSSELPQPDSTANNPALCMKMPSISYLLTPETDTTQTLQPANPLPSVPTNLPDLTVNLFELQDRMVLYGATRLMESKLGWHTMVQLDTYVRIFVGSVHGNILNEMKSGSNTDTSGNMTDNTSKLLFINKDGKKEWSLLAFLEKGINKYSEISKHQHHDSSPLSTLQSNFEINDNINPKLTPQLSTLLSEIEVLLMDKDDVDLLLNNFYENIYPYYPFLDIPNFEKSLSSILVVNNNRRCGINIGDKNIRSNLEILALFLIILTISLGSRMLHDCDSHLPKEMATNFARQLTSLARKLLHILNVPKFLNENGFCCLLYYYVLEYSNPNSLDIQISHTSTIALNNLTGLAITMGLYEQPNKFSRLFDGTDQASIVFNLRRKIWQGLQVLRSRVSLIQGDINRLDYVYMLVYADDTEYGLGTEENNNGRAPKFDEEFINVMDKRYKFQLSMTRLISSISSLRGDDKILTILENMKRAEEFLLNTYPLRKLRENKVNPLAKESFWRGGSINVQYVVNGEVLVNQLIGLGTMMTVYNVLFLHFEKKCRLDWKQYQPYYEIFLLETIRKYAQVLNILVEYLEGEYDMCLSKSHFLNFGHLIRFTLGKVWMLQASLLIRLSYKLEIRHVARKSNFSNQEDDGTDELLKSLQKRLLKDMKISVSLAQKLLSNAYIAASLTILFFEYVIYLADNNLLVPVTARFWQDIIKGDPEVPIENQKNVSLKWGLDVTKSSCILHSLMDPETLSFINDDILQKIIKILDDNKTCKSFVQPTPQSSTSVDNLENSVMQEFLNNNYEWVSSIIDDKLGTLPIL